MTIAVGRAPSRGWFDVLDDWLKRDRFVFVGWSGILLFPCAFLALGGWLTGTTFVTSWYTHGLASSYLEGTKLFNDAQSETVPYREGNIVNTFKTPTGYRFNQETTQYEKLVNGNYIPATDIGQYTLSNCSFREGIPYEDQISVYMAGRVLLKPARNNSKLVTHDFSITLYSDEVNSEGISGETEIVPDFTIEKQGETFVLKINPSIIFRTASLDIIPDIQIRAIQKIGKIWYTLNGLDTVQEDGTVQAKFLQNSAAELPDKFVYANRDITN
jgi:hypothetical protein